MQKWLSNIVILIALFFSTNVFAQSEQALLAKADSLFTKKKYTQAQSIYYQLYQSGRTTPAALLKMAYVHEGLGEVPKALFFLRAYYALTKDVKVYNKIMVLSNAYNFKGYELNDFDRVRLWIDKRITLIIGVLLLTASIILFVTVLRKNKLTISVKNALTVLVIIILSISLVIIDFGQPTSRGIVTKETYLMSGPSPGANLISVLPEGNLIPVTGTKDVWVKTQWNEKIGYIKSNDLLID